MSEIEVGGQDQGKCPNCGTPLYVGRNSPLDGFVGVRKLPAKAQLSISRFSSRSNQMLLTRARGPERRVLGVSDVWHGDSLDQPSFSREP